ncbi:MAG: ATP-dependent DNA helicase RecQ [bacterium P3]|nr:MAG: ATP-dependent DNA helicase RecQ [bacterium P3]KWW40396.1 MAG: ATP-dependent DNA helicase RecQ [bacterium F083]
MAQPAHDTVYYLRRYWGYGQFRPLQAEIIDAVLQGRDTLALLPTGGGKSICYQLPAVAMEGICLVVSPLVALMKDQVEQLRKRGIKASCLTSGMSGMEQSVVLNNCLYGGTKILYVSPERLRNKTFIGHLRQMKLSLIAVDEAHCIAQWGHDFRPAYLQIADIRKYHPQIPVLALTATATPQVATEIQQRLLMRRAQVFQGTFQRKNLAYMVYHESNKVERMVSVLLQNGGNAIVYVRNRRRCQQVAAQLHRAGLMATYYHAGLTTQERDNRQAQWMSGQVSVMVATNAFGMGIDKADVRCVIHLDLPDSLEAYFQEVGRAGRDGLKARAVMLYDESDMEMLRHTHEESFPSLQEIRNIYNAVCNYYQIPVGSGQDCSFDLDLGELSRTYCVKPVTLYAALQYLERIGLVSVPGREDHSSRLYIPIDKETLYRFQVSHPRYDTLIQCMLRSYGGLFTTYVNIYERQLARLCGNDVATVERMLLHLDALRIVSYRKRSNNPQIVFPSNRVDGDAISDGNATYRMLQESARRRMEAVIDYVSDTGHCRSGLLLAYFGERQRRPCGDCDYCIRTQQAREDETEMMHDTACRIVEILCRRNLSANELTTELCTLYPGTDIDVVEKTIRQLLDERRIGMTADFKLYA